MMQTIFANKVQEQEVCGMQYVRLSVFDSYRDTIVVVISIYHDNSTITQLY